MRIWQSCINLLLCFLITFAATSAFAKRTSIKPLQYPELQVSPLASERLKLESETEQTQKWTNSIYFQLSALATLTSSLTASTNDSDTAKLDDAKQVGLLVGLGWLIGNTTLLLINTPYTDGLAEISALPEKNIRQKLTRERLAEEKIQSAASFINKLKWISFFTNFGASVYIAANASESSVAIAAASGILSFAPLVFDHHWQKVHRQHQLYKKRIYAPLPSAGLVVSPEDRRLSPGLVLTASF